MPLPVIIKALSTFFIKLYRNNMFFLLLFMARMYLVIMYVCELQIMTKELKHMCTN